MKNVSDKEIKEYISNLTRDELDRDIEALKSSKKDGFPIVGIRTGKWRTDEIFNRYRSIDNVLNWFLEEKRRREM